MISRMRWHSIFLAGFLAFACALALAQDQAFANRSTELKDKAAADGKTLATLNTDTPVKVLQRSGGWTKVEASGQQGYVRAFHLRFPAAVESSSSSGGVLGSLAGGLFGGSKSGPRSTTVATTGIRGLSAEDFKNANPDAAAVAKMESYRADKASAQNFAREARLSSVSIAYLMEEAASGRRR
jgi:uncharacterized protein YgiM (DUF1202 family)